MDQAQIDRIRKNIARNDYSSDGPMLGIDVPQSYIDKMRILEEKYSKLKWLPLDIPRIEFDDLEEFKNLWNKESIDILRQHPDSAEPYTKEEHPLGKDSSWHRGHFKGLHLYHHPSIDISNALWKAKQYTGNNKQLKRILEQVYEYFPIHTLFHAFIWQSTKKIEPHQDQSAFWKCPTEFRVMLHDENTEPTLYVADIDNGEVTYIDSPADTNSFAWSNGTKIHGSDYHGKDKFLLVLNFLQHSGKSDELFEKSLNKYRNQLNYSLDI